MAAKYAYMLKPAGKEKCIKNEFYLQETSVYKGYTEKIFDMLFKSKEPLTSMLDIFYVYHYKKLHSNRIIFNFS